MHKHSLFFLEILSVRIKICKHCHCKLKAYNRYIYIKRRFKYKIKSIHLSENLFSINFILINYIFGYRRSHKSNHIIVTRCCRLNRFSLLYALRKISMIVNHDKEFDSSIDKRCSHDLERTLRYMQRLESRYCSLYLPRLSHRHLQCHVYIECVPMHYVRHDRRSKGMQQMCLVNFYFIADRDVRLFKDYYMFYCSIAHFSFVFFISFILFSRKCHDFTWFYSRFNYCRIR